jgi:preprotein translocase subunit SecD
MRHYSRWQTAAILGVTLLVSLAAVPNVLPTSTFDRLPPWAKRTFELGYDLQGGTYLQFEVDRNDTRNQVLENARETMRNVLRQHRIPFSGLTIRNGGVEAWIPEPEHMPRAIAAFEQLVAPLPAPAPTNERRALLVRHVDGRPSVWARPGTSPPPPQFKLDIADRIVRLTVNDAVYVERERQARDQAVNFITQRVYELGAGKLVFVSPSGTDRIVFDTKLDPEALNHLQY